MKRYFSMSLATILMLVALCLAPATTFAEGPGPAYEVRFTGVIESVPPESAEGTWEGSWVVAGQEVTVSAETLVKPYAEGRPPTVGWWAAVIARRNTDGDLVASQIVSQKPEIRLKGPVNSMPEGDAADERTGTWVIAGQNIEVVEDTTFNERYETLGEDRWAEVFALEEEGVLIAQRIRSVEFQEEVEIYGVIQDFTESWTLSTIELTVTAETIVTSEPKLGLLAHAAAQLEETEDGYSLTARNVRVMWQEPGGRRQPVQFRGVVEVLPSGGTLTGTWVVGGREVVVTDATVIKQVKGLVEVGSEVYVVGWEDGGVLQATKITVIAASWRGFAFYYAGPVEEMPQNGVVGYWTVTGQRVQVTQQTRVTGAEYARLGAPCEIGGVQRQDGVRVATWLRIRSSDGPGPGPTEPATSVE